jgi:hypothetical protein
VIRFLCLWTELALGSEYGRGQLNGSEVRVCVRTWSVLASNASPLWRYRRSSNDVSMYVSARSVRSHYTDYTVVQPTWIFGSSTKLCRTFTISALIVLLITA